MSDPVRVRFAPSPTGYLHIGGVRTALFNWLYAKRQGGTFVLRIEDTDHDRSTDESIAEIIESMHWLGLDPDEGPYRQTERQDIYTAHIKKLWEAGKAYPCTCTKERLDQLRKDQQAAGKNPRYDGHCRERTDMPDVPHVIRFKAPRVGTVSIDDLLRGNVSFDVAEFDDIIVQRTDGTPTYNFVVVVDDADMGITHVIRGDDHLTNTPKQALLYDALGVPRPRFAHISMILGEDKKRMSKRHGATSALAYRDMGFLPDALINYLARLGWSHGDQELFTRDEMIKLFSLESITTSAAVFNMEKLLWVNEQYIQNSDEQELAAQLEPFLVKEGVLKEGHGLSPEEISVPLGVLKPRAKTLVEMAQGADWYFKEDIEFDEKAKTKFLKAETKPLLETLMKKLTELSAFDHDSVESAFKQVVEGAGLKLGKLAQPVRVALTGKTASPGIYDVVLFLGKDRTLSRLKMAISLIG